MTQTIDLKIDLAGYDDARSIDLNQARRLIRGRRGHGNVETVRRWANPARGCRPRGPQGPVLVLPALKISGEWRTMPEWVEAFERKRQELGRQVATPPAARPARSREAAHHRAEAALDRAGVKAGARVT